MLLSVKRMSKNILIVFMILSVLMIGVYPEQKANTAHASGLAIGATGTIIIIALVIVICLIAMDQDLQARYLPYVQQGIDVFIEEFKVISIDFWNWVQTTDHETAVMDYFTELSNIYAENEKTLAIDYITGQRELPNKSVMDAVREFFSQSGINSTNINNGITNFSVVDSSTITFENVEMPLMDISQIDPIYTTPNSNTFNYYGQGISPYMILRYSPIDAFGSYRNSDGSFTLNSADIVDDTPGVMTETIELQLSDTVTVALTGQFEPHSGYQTSCSIGFMYWHSGYQAYQSLSQSFLNHVYLENWGTMTHNIATNYNDLFYDRWLDYTLIGYDSTNGMLYLYVYTIDTYQEEITYIKRLPLNDDIKSGSQFDNSNATINDYIIDDGLGIIDIPIPNLDAPLDNPIDDVLGDNNFVADETGAVDVIDGLTLSGELDQTLIDAIADAVAEAVGDAVGEAVTTDTVIPDVNLPETMTKYKLPNIIIQKFPFCLPWDLISLIKMLQQPAIEDTTIDLSFDWQFSNYQETFPFIIDLEWLGISRIAKLTKWLSMFMFIWFLISITRKLTLA